MLDRIIYFSLHQRMLVLSIAVVLLAVGAMQAVRLPIDVFPSLNRPRVVVISEAVGMAPEEVETLITLPLESAINGARGVVAVRSSSGPGISVVYVEFDWHTDIYKNRQIVNERLQLIRQRLPQSVQPTLAPVSSIMGQILMYGIWSDERKTDDMQVRTIADWVIRQRLLTIPGVSQIFTMGGQRKQYQVLVDADALRRFDLSMHQVHRAVMRSNLNATGGYLDQSGPNELLVRGLGRIEEIDDLKQSVIAIRQGRAITLSDVASVVEGGAVKRGDASAYVRGADGLAHGGPAVVLTVNKQPGSDTRRVDLAIQAALDELRGSLPADIRIEKVYSQRSFIDRAIDNVIEALADGGILVVVVLFLFLLNFRTTLVTLTAIPLSIVATACVFTAMGFSINTMTLGGLAVAIGELVDDAIVDVENIFRRLRENRVAQHPSRPLEVVFEASREVRTSIVYGTAIVVLVFLPMLALEGMEGRLFVPLSVAYIVSLLASLIIALSVTPALASLVLVGNRVWHLTSPLLALALSGLTVYWIIPRAGQLIGADGTIPAAPLLWLLVLGGIYWIVIQVADRILGGPQLGDGLLLRFLKSIAAMAINLSTRAPGGILLSASICVIVAAMALWNRERDFLPPFNEGSVQVNAILSPGTSLATSNEIGSHIEQELLQIPTIVTLVRRTGRAELDEHAEGVNVSEIVVELAKDADRAESIQQIRKVMAEIPGVVSSTEQPIAHLISHMLSGVKAQIGIKLYGDDLSKLREIAESMRQKISDVEGLTDVFVEQQASIPQLRIELRRNALVQYGLQAADVMEFIETAMNGKVVNQVVAGQRTFDLVLRMNEEFRQQDARLRRLAIKTPEGSVVPLESVADIYRSEGPGAIKREGVRRRIVLQANVSGRGVVDVVSEIRERLSGIQLPDEYFIEYGGQFQSQQSASRRLAALSGIALTGMLLVLYTLFGNLNFAIQVLVALPAAFVGAVIALVVTDQNLTIAAMVGFISLCGIASRNGILLLNHYLHLVQHEGESWTSEMVCRAGQERLAPVLMTAITSGIGLLPLAASAGEPGKELLYPVATVIIGGLITCTLAEFFVRPALFWLVGVDAGRRILADREQT